MKLKRHQIIEQINLKAIESDVSWNQEYISAKTKINFICNKTGVAFSQTWDNIRNRGISRRNSKEYILESTTNFIEKQGFILLTNTYNKHTDRLKYKCKKCNLEQSNTFNRIRTKKTLKCIVCDKVYSNNKIINNKHVLKHKNKNYYLYFVQFENCYKIGLYRRKNIKGRFSRPFCLLKIYNLPLYKAYFIEQLVINKFTNLYPYTGERFHGYTEAFNLNLPLSEVYNYLLGALEYSSNVEPRELLESLEVDNQQPSFDSNILEGSTTRSES